MQKQIAAGEFKAKCLALLDEVNEHHVEFVITKRGKPVARIVPMQDSPRKHWLGGMEGTIEIVGDIISPIDVEWNADSK